MTRRVRWIAGRVSTGWRRVKSSRAFPPFLFLATCCSTAFVGYVFYGDGSASRAALFCVPLMTILLAHELGHWLQLRRYRIDSTPPFFLPFPAPPLGTFGAVLKIKGRFPNRRALFDVGATGPIAGLVASLIFLTLGLTASTVSTAPPSDGAPRMIFGAPLAMRGLATAIFGASEAPRYVLTHPCAVAGWIGLFLTALNLVPVGQLDGGHALYALLGQKRSRAFSRATLLVFCALAVLFRYWGWFLFVAILFALGIRRRPTEDDAAPLGLGRAICGTLTLAWLIVGFAPRPLEVKDPAAPGNARVDVVETRAAPFEFYVELPR